MKLLDAFCVPLLIYSTEAIRMNKKEYNYLESAYLMSFAKFFGTYNTDTLRSCQYYCGSLPLCYRIDSMKIRFLQNIKNCNNLTLINIYNRCGLVELNKLRQKYNLSDKDSIVRGMWTHFELSLNI